MIPGTEHCFNVVSSQPLDYYLTLFLERKDSSRIPLEKRKELLSLFEKKIAMQKASIENYQCRGIISGPISNQGDFMKIT